MEVPLRNSEHFAVVDDCFHEEVSCQNWYVTTLGYVRTTHACPSRIYLHKLIMGEMPGYDIDHIDGDKLNNQMSNLRYVTRSQQQCNRRMPCSNTSGHVGVRRNRYGRWEAIIRLNHQNHFLGVFSTFEEAVIAREKATQELHGEYARKAG